MSCYVDTDFKELNDTGPTSKSEETTLNVHDDGVSSSAQTRSQSPVQSAVVVNEDTEGLEPVPTTLLSSSSVEDEDHVE